MTCNVKGEDRPMGSDSTSRKVKEFSGKQNLHGDNTSVFFSSEAGIQKNVKHFYTNGKSNNNPHKIKILFPMALAKNSVCEEPLMN